MKISVDRETGDISISVEELSYFSRTKRSTAMRIMNFSEIDAPPFFATDRNYSLECAAAEGKLPFNVLGFADNVYLEDDLWVVEKILVVGKVTNKTNPYTNVRFLCESVLVSYMLCVEKGDDAVLFRLIVMSDDAEKSKAFECILGLKFMQSMFESVTERALPFIAVLAEKELRGKEEFSKMPFPYYEIRDGQKEFIFDTYHSAKVGSRLLVSAPTGIGKTISALYPALRALGDGHIDRIFYLTAKTVTGKAALDAVSKMACQVKSLRAITVLAKDRVCPMSERKSGACMLTCTLAGEIDGVPFEARRDRAMIELLKLNIITSDAIEKTALENKICPYELSLDLSEYCEVIVCDYNYVFDEKVSFRRYFSENTGEKYMFLIDEAHNLPDRTREMYSAEIDSNDFLQLYKTDEPQLLQNRELMGALREVIKQLKNTALKCSEEESTFEGKTYGHILSREIPEKLTLSMISLAHIIGAVIRNEPELEMLLKKVYESVRTYSYAATYANAKFVFFAESVNGRLKISIRCLDPSEILDRRLSLARSSVFFSATFSPMDYFADILGSPNAAQLELDSPYDSENLLVCAVDSVTTKYSRREECIDEIAEMIYSVIEAKKGNYIVYFPSYEYMKKVYSVFSEFADGIKFIMQKNNMTFGERNKFLSMFKENRSETLVGFCVLGGAFSEGIDLQGEKLIGTIIVGTGLPKLSAELNILQNYYEETRENGYDYAYTYPSVVKVQQAAGRVIRSESDRGVVILMDERYREPSLLRLLPKMWRKLKLVSDADTLGAVVERFWAKFDSVD